MDKTLLELRHFNEETSEGELWIGKCKCTSSFDAKITY